MGKILGGGGGEWGWHQRISLTSFFFPLSVLLLLCTLVLSSFMWWSVGCSQNRGHRDARKQSLLYSQVLETQSPCTPRADTWRESQGVGSAKQGGSWEGVKTLDMCLRWWPWWVHKRRQSMENISLVHLNTIRSWWGVERDGNLWWAHLIALAYSFTWVACSQLVCVGMLRLQVTKYEVLKFYSTTCLNLGV